MNDFDDCLLEMHRILAVVPTGPAVFGQSGSSQNFGLIWSDLGTDAVGLHVDYLTLPYLRGGWLHEQAPNAEATHGPSTEPRQTTRSVKPLRSFCKL